jgi:hypothetical protein
MQKPNRPHRPLLHIRGVWPALLVLVVMILAVGLRIAGDVAAPPSLAAPAKPTPPATAPTAAARAVVRSLGAFQRAYNAGDVRLLCRPGGLVDPALIRQQDAQKPGCEPEQEALMANEPPLQLTVGQVRLRRDLATATVTPARGGSVRVDLVRDGGRWLLSFSDGGDPMPALTGSQ